MHRVHARSVTYLRVSSTPRTGADIAIELLSEKDCHGPAFYTLNRYLLFHPYTVNGSRHAHAMALIRQSRDAASCALVTLTQRPCVWPEAECHSTT